MSHHYDSSLCNSKPNMSLSSNCVDWHLLQDPNQETITKAELIKGRFIGDPSYEVKTRLDNLVLFRLDKTRLVNS